MTKNVNDILKQALAGTRETKPHERRLFLTTILERIYVALTKRQVQAAHMYSEVEQRMKEKTNLYLYINGDIAYHFYKQYIELATTYNVPYTIVNPHAPTPFGLVLAHKTLPVHVDQPYIIDTLHQHDIDTYEKKR